MGQKLANNKTKDFGWVAHSQTQWNDIYIKYWQKEIKGLL